MDSARFTISLAVGAVIAVLLQMVCAPNIALFGAFSNFIAVYVLVVSVVNPDRFTVVLAFALGLLFDLLGSGPVGAMAFLLTLVSYLASRAFFALDNDTLFIPLFVLAVSFFAVELFYGVFLAGTGAAGFLEACVFRALPCALYDCAAALVIYPLVFRFVSASNDQRPLKSLIR